MTITEHLRFLPTTDIASWTYIEHQDTDLYLLGAQLIAPGPGERVELAYFGTTTDPSGTVHGEPLPLNDAARRLTMLSREELPPRYQVLTDDRSAARRVEGCLEEMVVVD